VKKYVLKIIIVCLAFSLLAYFVYSQNKKQKIAHIESTKINAMTTVILAHQKATNQLIEEFATTGQSKEVYLNSMKELAAKSIKQIDEIKADYQKQIEEVK